MFRKGIGEHTEFSEYNPLVNLAFYVLAIGVTMFSTSPWFLAATFVMAWVYSLLLKGRRALRLNLLFVFWIVVVMAVINVCFTHDGETVLFYLHGNRITVEALIFGISAAVMLSSVLIWFTSFNVIMTAEKLIFIFGRAAPVLGLTLSMIFRFIPLLRSRYAEIRMGQECLGQGSSSKTPLLKRIRQAGKNVSILVSWSLEASIESADSMEARGYGLRGRTSFHLYRFSARDARMMIWLLILGGTAILGCAFHKCEAWFYPVYELHPFDALTAASLAAFILLLATPIVIDITGELRWKRSDLTM